MKTIEEHNQAALGRWKEEQSRRAKTGVACPTDGTELEVLDVWATPIRTGDGPAQHVVVCPQCNSSWLIFVGT